MDLQWYRQGWSAGRHLRLRDVGSETIVRSKLTHCFTIQTIYDLYRRPTIVTYHASITNINQVTWCVKQTIIMSPIFLSVRRCGRINVLSDLFHSLIRIFSNFFGTLWVDGGYCSKLRVQFRRKSNGMLWTANLSFKLIYFTIFEMSMNILNLKIGIYHKITSRKKCRRIIEPVRQPLPPPMII